MRFKSDYTERSATMKVKIPTSRTFEWVCNANLSAGYPPRTVEEKTKGEGIVLLPRSCMSWISYVTHITRKA